MPGPSIRGCSTPSARFLSGFQSMRDFNKISPTIWQSRDFRDLPSDDARYLLLYLMTCQHQNSSGAFALPEGYACADLAWTADNLRKNRDALQKAFMIYFEPETDEYSIMDWFEHNPLMNQKHVAGAKRIAEKLQSPELKEKTLKAIEANTPAQQVQQTRYAQITR
jgi:hypothetical protein